MIDANNEDGLYLHANTTGQAESLLHRLEQPVKGFGLYVNADNIKFICLKQKEAISTFSGKHQKLED